jgi:hypothetical protein
MRFFAIIDGVNTTIAFTPTTEWARYTTTVTAITSLTLAQFRGNGFVGDMAIWGAQLEAGSFATTYIPTTTATVTRVGESFTRNNVYTNGFISDAGGTWFVDLSNNITYTRDASVNTLFIADTNVGGTNGFVLRNTGGSNTRLVLNKRLAGFESTLFNTATNDFKLAIKWNGTSADVFVNGSKVVSASAFTPTQLQFLGGLGNDVPKYINQSALFPVPMTDAQCIQLTT